MALPLLNELLGYMLSLCEYASARAQCMCDLCQQRKRYEARGARLPELEAMETAPPAPVLVKL